MPTNFFPNATEDECRAMAESLQRMMTTGEIGFVTLPGGGQMQRKQIRPENAPKFLKMVLYSWHLLNPAEIDNPYIGRITRTRPSYV